MSPDKTSHSEKIKELEEALTRKDKELQQALSETQEFLHLASHDLQAPFRKLDTFVDRLLAKLKDHESEDIKQYTSRIHAIVGQTREMIDGLARMAAISPLPLAPVNLQTVVAQVAKDKHLKPGQVTTHNLSYLNMSAEHLKTILKELIDNSIKFHAGEDDLQINISAKPVQSSANIIEITYLDNGIGIDDSHADAVFKPFTRLHGSQFAGPGLGLAIVKKIVALYNGTICVSSTMEPGARFVIHLPASAQHAES